MIFKGFLLGIGFVLGLAAILLLISLIGAAIITLRLRSRYVTRHAMEAHLASLSEQEHFEEADRINQLLTDNKGIDRIKIPDHYRIELTFTRPEDSPLPFRISRRITPAAKKEKSQPNKDSTGE